MKRRGESLESWLPDVGLLWPMRAPKPLWALLLLLLNQPPSIIGRRGWWSPLPQKTRAPARALSLREKRAGDVTTPSHSASDGRAPSFRDYPLSASSPCDLIMHEGGGRVFSKVTKCSLRSSSQPSFNKPSSAFKIKRWWRAWVRTPYRIVRLKALGSSSSHLASP